MRCFFRGRRKGEECSSFFLENGSKLLEALLSASNGRYGIPFRNFTDREVISATRKFQMLVMSGGTGHLFKGSYLQRPILVKRIYHDDPWLADINGDIVISVMMSHHNNVLKFMGCCLDFKCPALVYEYDGHHQLVSDILNNNQEQSSKNDSVLLCWSNKLKIATDVGNALVYLHTAFSTPIIRTNLSPRNIMIDQFGVAKLLDFSFCVSLPPGESQVQLSCIAGVTGYLAPDYMRVGIVTDKTDVYMFRALLLMLFTGKKCYEVIDSLLHETLDSVILQERKEPTQQLQAVTELAYRCCQYKGEDRPDMIGVAKELSRIERSGRSG